MLVLIVDDDHIRQAKLAIAFTQAGFQTASTGCQSFAECFVRTGLVDLLVMTERVGGRLTHSLSLLAEHKNPMVETILLTPRCDTDIEELFLLLPSLHCLVAPDISPALITKLAIAAFTGAKNHSGSLLLMEEDEIVDEVDFASPFSAVRPQENWAEELLESA